MYLTADGHVLALSAPVNSYPKAAAGTAVLQGTRYNDSFHSSARETMLGGAGDDSYNLWQAGGSVVELAGEGVDTVYGRYWGGVALADNVENLVLVSAGATFGFGNRLDNIIIAGEAGARLDGREGNDVLVGGAGDDIFILSAGNGSDAIMNFRPGHDTVALDGYGFGIGSWGELSSRMRQAGGDVAIDLGHGEKLVIRDMQLSDLDGADFGMRLAADPLPAQHVLVDGAWGAKAANGWSLFNNIWGARDLQEGVDYSMSSHVDPTDMTAGGTFNWAFPIDDGSDAKVLAYPGVMFGVWPHGDDVANRVGVFPIRLSDLQTFTADYDISYEGSNGFNVAFDIWLTSKPYGDASTITDEVMIWAHTGDFGSGGTAVGTYSKDGFTATIYHRDNYTALIPDGDVPAASIDVADILKTLAKMGLVSTQDYVASIELGAEVSGGAGSLTINNLDLKVTQVGASGEIISHDVTGAGTQTVVTVTEDASQSKPAPAPVMEPVTNASGDVTGYTLVEDRGVFGLFTSHFDPAGQLVGSEVAKAEAAGAIRTTYYDAAGAVSGSALDVPQGGGASRSYHFDAQGALTKSTLFSRDADGGHRAQHFDAKGAFIGADVSTIDSAGVHTVTHYDAASKVVSRVLTGTDGNDKLYGGGSDNILRGGDGDDVLVGGGASDTLIGGEGRDFLRGLGGADRFVFDRSTDTGNSRGTSDTIQGFNAAEGDRVDLSAIDADSTLAGHQSFVFTAAKPADAAAGSLWVETSVEAGTWELRGDVDGDGKSDFMIEVAAGGKPLTVDAMLGAAAPAAPAPAGPREVTIEEAGGTRTIHYDGNGVVTASEFKVVLAGGATRTYFYDSADALLRSEIADLDGAGAKRIMHFDAQDKFQGADTVAWSANGVRTDIHFGADWKVQTRLSTGTDGEDVIYGGSGANTLRGGAGNDMLGGAGGADVLVGGSGRDTLKGFAGPDRFLFEAVADTGNSRDTGDWILDFNNREGDRIDLSAIDANSLVEGDQFFIFAAAKPATAMAGSLWLEGAGRSWDLRGDIDGDGKADFLIHIDTLFSNGLGAGDLIL